jgi:hypothetical protein
MNYRENVMVYHPVRKAAVAVDVELDIDLPSLAQHMAQQAMRNKRRRSTSAGKRVKARVIGMTGE